MDEKEFEINFDDLPFSLSDEIWSLLFPYLDEKKTEGQVDPGVSEEESRAIARRGYLRYLTM